MAMPKLCNTVIDDQTYKLYVPGGSQCAGGMGLIPRDFRAMPEGYLGKIAEPYSDVLIPENEWDARIEEQETNKSSLQHIYDTGNFGKPIEPLDQNGQGYCWSYSSTGGNMAIRARQGLPHVRLSAHMPACIIKNYRDEGGWNSLSLKFIVENGVAPVSHWPEQSMSRSNDTPAMRAEAAKYKIQEWWDLSENGSTVKQQIATLLLLNVPVMLDLMWWGHSVFAVRLIKRSPFTVRIMNSWGRQWGDRGYGDLVDSKAIPQGSAAPRVVMAA